MSNEAWNVRPIAWHRSSENEMTGRLRRILQKWLPYADRQYAVWQGRPGCGHFFGGAYWYGLETAYTASVYALLAQIRDYDETAAGIPREEVKRKAVSAIRYLGFTHDTGPEDCVRAEGRNRFCSLTKWGGRGQAFFPASQTGVTVAFFGLSAWLIWDDLDEETRSLVRNVLIDYADRWCGEEPRNGTYHDTQSEENAWTAGGIAAALAMFPEHPRRERWRAGFAAWSINAITTSSDRVAERGTPAGTSQARVKAVTFHPDFTTENHGFAHPGYICAGMNLRGIHAVFALMGDQPVSDTVLYNNTRLYERTIKLWSQFDGLAVPVQGQDWWYNRQHERQLTHALMNVLHGDRDAARLERNALDIIEKLQNSNAEGCLLEEDGEQCVISGYQTAKDMEHTSAHDLVTSCLLHMFGGAGAEPSDPVEMAERLSGVYVYPFGGTAVHRTRNSFSSFSWRNRVMALTLPADGLWCVTPLLASYTGTVKFAGGAERSALANERIVLQTVTENIRNYGDGFGAVATLARGEGELMQDVAFVSLPGGETMYAERFRVLRPCAVSEIHTGMIGIRNEHYRAMPELASGRRTLHLPDRSETFAGFYGREPNYHVCYPPAGWVNVDDKMGYVLFGSQGIGYVNQHEYPKWKGVEDILILNRSEAVEYGAPQTLPCFTAISLPNRSKEETIAAARETHLFACDGEGVVLAETAGRLVFANFSPRSQTIRAARPLNSPVIPLFEGSNRIERGIYVWSGSLDALTSGYRSSEWQLKAEAAERLSFDVSILPDRIYWTNRSPQPVRISLLHGGKDYGCFTVEAGATEGLESPKCP